MAKDLIKLLPVNLTSIAKKILADLPTAQVYLVGGAVRDLLLGRPTKDYDLVVRGVSIPKLEHWLANHGQVNLVGKTFGVYKWQPAGWADEAIDVALPRREHTSIGSGQYRDFTIQSNPNLPIEQDLLRRDFTINALALNLKNGRLIDPTKGQADLKKKIIKTVGRAETRFNEDLSRALRGLRQACQLNFSINPTTLAAIKKLSQRASLGKKGHDWLVPREIIARELLKSLAAQPERALNLLDKTGFLAKLLPEVVAMKKVPQPPQFHSEGDVYQHTLLALASLKTSRWQKFFPLQTSSLNVIVATLLHDIGKPTTLKIPAQHGVNRIRTDGHDVEGARLTSEICQRLKLSSYVDPTKGQAHTEAVAWLVKNHLILAHGSVDIFKPATLYRYFLKDPVLGLELQQVIFADMAATRPQPKQDLTLKLLALRQRLVEVNKKLTGGKLKLLLSGNEIMKHFSLPPGPKIGTLLKALEEAQLSGAVKTKKQALVHLKKQL